MARPPKPKSLPADWTTVHDSPEYVAAEAKLMQVRARMGDVERRIQAEQGRLNAAGAVNRHRAEAEAFVYDRPMPAKADATPPADMKQLNDEMAMLREAEWMAERRMAEVEIAVSRRVCERAYPIFQDLVRRTDAAAAALVDICEEERAMAAALSDGGLHWLFQRVPWPAASTEALARFREEAREHFGLELG